MRNGYGQMAWNSIATNSRVLFGSKILFLKHLSSPVFPYIVQLDEKKKKERRKKYLRSVKSTKCENER